MSHFLYRDTAEVYTLVSHPFKLGCAPYVTTCLYYLRPERNRTHVAVAEMQNRKKNRRTISIQTEEVLFGRVTKDVSLITKAYKHFVAATSSQPLYSTIFSKENKHGTKKLVS